MDKIIFFHMNQLGDLLFSLPALSAFRNERKDAHLCSYIKPELAPILLATELVNEVISKPKSVFGKIGAYNRIRRAGFSEAVLFSESPETALLSRSAPVRSGFKTSAVSFLYTRNAPRTGVPSLRNNRALAQLCGLKSIPEDYSGLVKVPESELKKAEEWLALKGISGKKLVVISAGASKRRAEKCWSLNSWIDVLEFITKKDAVPLITGTKNELEEMEFLADSVRPKPLVYNGSEGILFLAALMKLSKLFIGIDSGAAHLSAAVGLKTIGLYGPTDPSQIGPHPLNKNIVIKKKKMVEITADMVFDAAERLI